MINFKPIQDYLALIEIAERNKILIKRDGVLIDEVRLTLEPQYKLSGRKIECETTAEALAFCYGYETALDK